MNLRAQKRQRTENADHGLWREDCGRSRGSSKRKHGDRDSAGVTRHDDRDSAEEGSNRATVCMCVCVCVCVCLCVCGRVGMERTSVRCESKGKR